MFCYMFPTNFLLNVLDQINKACDYFLQSFVRSWRKDNVVNLVIVKSVVFNVGRRHLLSPLHHHQRSTSDPASVAAVAQANFFGEENFLFLVVKLLSYTKFIFT